MYKLSGWQQFGTHGSRQETWLFGFLLLQDVVVMHPALDARLSARCMLWGVCAQVNGFMVHMYIYVRPASTQYEQTAAVAVRLSSPWLPCNEEWSIHLLWRKDMFIQLLLTGSEKRKTDYRSTLVKCQHNTAQVAKTDIKRCSRSVNRRPALSESAKNKQTFWVYK